ncbi:LysR family transcriptional regulator [Limnobacter humi]|uniref:LysR family transcriptional regulator n=1 Tax=Limnobacter humi TaxID=1778671 RepID=A0ABT1WD73_9BURK|nr:LysR family transcriptional regulator [Limnobacter humi]MCQ8895445.1 LysR family transcriptional regulator [Limnobacter humi]
MKLTDLNFHHLRYFWMVAKTGSLTAAAERLGLRAQTLSSQIAQLEQSLGRSLFQPVGRGLGLTEAGRVALRYADQIFQLGEQLTDSLEDEELDYTLRLSVGIADALPKTVSFHMIEPVLALKRPVRLVCTEGRFEALCAELIQHNIDLVLAERPGGQGTANLQVAKLLAYPVRIFGSAALCADKRADFPKSLQGAPFLMPSRNNVLRMKLEHWLETEGISVRVVGEFDDLALLDTFGRAGLGLFAVPALLMEDYARGTSVEYLGDVEGVLEEYYAFTHPRNMEHPAIKALFATAVA